MSGPPRWRLILDPAQDGFANMARDEAMLEACRAGSDPGAYPVLRLYAWLVPTLSLGRFQDARRAVDLGFCRDRGIPVVRRPTGGGAVLHDREVTYALVGPTDREPFGGGLIESYRRIAEGIAAGLRLLGVEPDPPVPGGTAAPLLAPAPCFARPSSYEITFEGKKLVGSAQVRRRGAALQHGSILLDARPDLFEEAAGGRRPGERGWTTLKERLGRVPEFEEVAVAVARGIGSSLGIEWTAAEGTGEEAIRSERLRAGKYLSAHWTGRGRLSFSRT